MNSLNYFNEIAPKWNGGVVSFALGQDIDYKKFLCWNRKY